MPRNKEKMRTSLRDVTLKMLRERPKHITYNKISEETGLTERWLQAFAHGKIVDPGVNETQTLYEYATGTLLSHMG